MKQPRRRTYGRLEYSPLTEALRGAGFEGIRKSVTRRQNTIAQYIAMRPILYLCERSTWKPGVRGYWRWWEQDGIDLEGCAGRVATRTAMQVHFLHRHVLDTVVVL